MLPRDDQGEPLELSSDVHDLRVAMERLLGVTRASLEQRAQLERALEARVIVEQAKGVLAERHGLTVDEAYEALRAAARSTRARVRDLAQQVVERPGTPNALQEALGKRVRVARAAER